MISHVMNLVRRDTDQSATINHTMLNLLVVLLVLVLLVLLLVASLLYMRQRRRARSQTMLPLYDEKRASTSSTSSHHRRVMVRPSESIYVYEEKKLSSEDSPPPSPIPEIRITFPEEIDASGKRQSGRVVVVRVGDSSMGLEPVAETLPSYEKDGERFHSLDLERIGGLVEKARNAPHNKEWE